MKVFLYKIGFILFALYYFSSYCIAAKIDFGPYEVGFQTYQVYDNSRPYILNEDTISRPLLIHFWYPSEEIGVGHSLKFKDYIDLIAIREDFGKNKSDIDLNSFQYVEAYSNFAKSNFDLDTSISVQYLLDSPVYAKNGVPVKIEGSEYPLLIYAPSNSKASVQNHILCEYLASHGFMILSVASAGPNSISRRSFRESTMAQVTDMEYLLDFCEDSLKIQYKSLGLFGFSSGGNAITIFQMRNRNVGAVLSLDGGQEYSTYIGLYSMLDFDLEKTDVPYLSFVNNYENFSIYPMYNSIISKEKYLYRMSNLGHNGFISYWTFFNGCSSDTIMGTSTISFENLAESSVRFFSKYLKNETFRFSSICMDEHAKGYMRAVEQDYSNINILCKMLLNNDLDSASRFLELHKALLFGKANQVNLLARMFSDNKLAEWLYKKCIEYQPYSWEAHYDLACYYKDNGKYHEATQVLLEAMKLSPENRKITELLIELEKMD